MPGAFRMLAVLALTTCALAIGAGTGTGSDLQSGRITIFARPTVVAWAQSATLYGAAQGAGQQDIITVEVRECGSTFFRTFVELHPSSGGGWSTPVGSAITSTYRATWRNATSAEVTIRQGANVSLVRERSSGRLVVAVSAKRSFWRKPVRIERRTDGRWRLARQAVLTDSVSSNGVVSVSEARFRLAVPRGTLLRAVLPAPQARPCYVASTSRVFRT